MWAVNVCNRTGYQSSAEVIADGMRDENKNKISFYERFLYTQHSCSGVLTGCRPRDNGE